MCDSDPLVERVAVVDALVDIDRENVIEVDMEVVALVDAVEEADSLCDSESDTLPEIDCDADDEAVAVVDTESVTDCEIVLDAVKVREADWLKVAVAEELSELDPDIETELEKL